LKRRRGCRFKVMYLDGSGEKTPLPSEFFEQRGRNGRGKFHSAAHVRGNARGAVWSFTLKRLPPLFANYQPMRDRRGYGGCAVNFGSAHANAFNMSLCDGSVRGIKYEIDLETNRRLGCRNDRKPVDMNSF
jgi:prepilin-type processing-associated H-X9-DG protein